MTHKPNKVRFSSFYTILVHVWAIFDVFWTPKPKFFEKHGWKTITRPGLNFVNNLSKISGVPMTIKPNKVRFSAFYTIFVHFWDIFDVFWTPKPNLLKNMDKKQLLDQV